MRLIDSLRVSLLSCCMARPLAGAGAGADAVQCVVPVEKTQNREKGSGLPLACVPAAA